MARFVVALRQGLAQAALGGLWIYRYFFSPWLGFHCRFHPTCSYYAKEALTLHGPGKGAYLALLRVLRCHPWHPGGLDSVPQGKLHLKKREPC